jgi:hypothetical protein
MGRVDRRARSGDGVALPAMSSFHQCGPARTPSPVGPQSAGGVRPIRHNGAPTVPSLWLASGGHQSAGCRRGEAGDYQIGSPEGLGWAIRIGGCLEPRPTDIYRPR